MPRTDSSMDGAIKVIAEEIRIGIENAPAEISVLVTPEDGECPNGLLTVEVMRSFSLNVLPESNPAWDKIRAPK